MEPVFIYLLLTIRYSLLPIRSLLFATYYLPFDRFAAAIDQRFFVRSFDLYFLGRRPGRLLKRDRLLVDRELVVTRTIERREGFKLVERAFFLENLGVALDRDRRVDQARNAVECKFPRDRVRRRIGAEEIARLPRSRGLAQGRAVLRGFDHRHAIHVGLEPPAEPVGPGERHVIGRDGAAHLWSGTADEIDAVPGRQVFQDHAQARKLACPLREVALDEHGLAIENVDLGIDVFPVHQERHVDLFHAFQYAHDFAVVGDAGGRIGGGIRRIKLHAREHLFAKTALDVVGVGVVGEVAGHERPKG